MAYLEKGAKYGFTRIFSCLLSVEKSPAEIKAEFLEMNRFAKNPLDDANFWKPAPLLARLAAEGKTFN